MHVGLKPTYYGPGIETSHMYVHEQEVTCKRAQEGRRVSKIEASINLTYSVEIIFLFSK